MSEDPANTVVTDHLDVQIIDVPIKFIEDVPRKPSDIKYSDVKDSIYLSDTNDNDSNTEIRHRNNEGTEDKNDKLIYSDPTSIEQQDVETKEAYTEVIEILTDNEDSSKSDSDSKSKSELSG